MRSVQTSLQRLAASARALVRLLPVALLLVPALAASSSGHTFEWKAVEPDGVTLTESLNPAEDYVCGEVVPFRIVVTPMDTGPVVFGATFSQRFTSGSPTAWPATGYIGFREYVGVVSDTGTATAVSNFPADRNTDGTVTVTVTDVTADEAFVVLLSIRLGCDLENVTLSGVAQANLDVGGKEVINLKPTGLDGAHITIEKEAPTVPAQDFGFTLENATESTDATLGAGDSLTFGPLFPGSYSLSEDLPLPDGWSFESLVCGTHEDGNGESSIDEQANTATIDLADGDHVECTFTNAYTAPPDPTAQILVEKVTSDGQNSDDWSFDLADEDDQGVTDTANDDQTTLLGEFAPGTYQVQEGALPEGWSLVSITGDDTGDLDGVCTIDIPADQPAESYTCTFTNQFTPPFVPEHTASVTKVTDPEGQENGWTFDLFAGQVGGEPLDSATTDGSGSADFDALLDPGGVYVVTERARTGWTLDGTQGPNDEGQTANVTCVIEVPENAQSSQNHECVFFNSQNPVINPTLNASVALSKTPDVSTASVGDTITYTYVIRNTGDVAVATLALADDILGAITLDATILGVGESTTATATHTVTEADLPGPVVNVATVTGTSSRGNVSDQADASVDLTSAPGLEVVKTASTQAASVGTAITYEYVVTNTGDVTLTDVSATDDLLGPVTLGATTLAPGESTVGELTTTVGEADLPGPIVNVAVVTGTPPVGDDVSGEDSATVDLTSTPSIDVVKTALVDENLDGFRTVSFSATDGDDETVVYQYVVTNTGDVTLTDVAAVDNILGAITLDSTTLAPGASATGTATHVVTQTDADTGVIDNVVLVAGTAPGGAGVEAQDDERVFVESVLGIVIENPDTPAPAPAPPTVVEPTELPRTGADSSTALAVALIALQLGALLHMEAWRRSKLQSTR